ncbi:chemotaxis protein CheW [Desulfococcaceae bacterium HSG8]|nr:chemotaxis protein CheW [Desulfococcaceae bacterium HSG8]
MVKIFAVKTNLIFMPGFSTLSRATEVSGRGVGLDVVKSNITSLGGNITISDKPDKGVRMRLRVPVSISFTDVLLAEVSGRHYAFPFSSILKTLRIRRREIYGPENREIIHFEGNVLSVRHIGEILGIAGVKGKIGKKDSDDEISIILIIFGNQILGLVVDTILNRETILIRPLEKYLAGIREFSGAALLGDGSVVLVIDPMGIIY